MGEVLSQLGVGGLLALLLVREVLGFLGKRKAASNGGHDTKEIPAWFVNEKFVQVVERITRTLENQEKLLERLLQVQEATSTRS